MRIPPSYAVPVTTPYDPESGGQHFSGLGLTPSVDAAEPVKRAED